MARRHEYKIAASHPVITMGSWVVGARVTRLTHKLLAAVVGGAKPRRAAPSSSTDPDPSRCCAGRPLRTPQAPCTPPCCPNYPPSAPASQSAPARSPAKLLSKKLLLPVSHAPPAALPHSVISTPAPPP